MARHAAPGPIKSPLHPLLGQFAVGRVRNALVEGHDDIGPDGVLNLHDFFGRKHMAGTVVMRFEHHAVVGDFGDVLQ